MAHCNLKDNAEALGTGGLSYVATHQRGRAPSVGEQIELVVQKRKIKWSVSEIFKEHSTRSGTDLFTVRVEETEENSDAS
jgi:hypothetical protein